MQDKTPALTEVTWNDVRLRVKTIAPDIFEAIERLDPDKSYRLYLARYPFGAMMVDNNSIFNIPYKEQLFPINDPHLPTILRNDLKYSASGAMPLALILANRVQLFTEEQKNEIEIDGVFSLGAMLASRRILDPELSYHAARFFRMTSGLRTTVFLPSISEQTAFDRLRRYYGLTVNKPETQHEQWRLLVEIANHKNFPDYWFTEILLFSAKWIKPSNDDAGKLFKLALLERSWKISAYPRNILQVNRIWTKFITNLNNKKATSFVLNMVRHIIEASLGQAISYVPCDEGNNGGPFDALSKTIIDIYGLKKSAPIFMVPTYFDLDNPTTNFISIQAPGSPWASARPGTISNLINDEREIKYILHQFINLIRDNVINVSDTPFSRLTEIDYTFYHADKDKYGELLSSANALDGHPIMEKWRKHLTNNELAYRNTFMRSCVKIEVKKKG